MAVGNRKRGFGGPATKRTKSALRTARGSEPRASLYDELTAKIIAQLEAGCFPWAQPWNSAAAVPGLPRNAVSGRPYSGVNVLILWGAVIEGSYPSQDWLTFRQALAAGGCVRKGERGHTIFYADRFTPEGRGEDGRNGGEGAEGEPRSIPFLKRFVVFNAAQCDGLPERLTADPTPLPEREQHEGAEALIVATGADFRIGGARAFYDIGGDYVQVPPQPAFTHQIEYRKMCPFESGQGQQYLVSAELKRSGASPLPHPTSQSISCLGGRVGERAGAVMTKSFPNL
jgi:antirestriction protein ArdC